MSTDRSTTSPKTLADLVASAIGPVLIMTLIGSLVFFLIEVLYIGAFHGRLLWCMFFYIVGAVLVARISMRGDINSRAGMYGLVLGLLMWIALMIYVEFPAGTWQAELRWAIHLGFILLIGWSAHRLTWDSTLDEDRADVSGAGLLDAAGLGHAGEDTHDDGDSTRPSRTRRKAQRGLIAWWERYQRYSEQKNQRPRTHGVWVVYFSLAALPLFGLGQAAIPPDQVGRRQYAFWMLCIYVASGLGLLLCTTFLSLRRYLRQRKLRMPAVITATWLFSGAGLIAALLVLGALLPRPNPEYSVLSQFLPDRSPKQDESDQKAKDGEPNKDKGTQGKKSSEDAGDKDGSAKGSKSGSSDKGGGEGGGKSSDSQQKQGGSGDQKDKEQQGDGKKKGSESSSSPQSPSTSAWFEWLKPVANVLKWIVLAAVVLLVVIFVARALLSFLANFTGWARGLLDWLNSFWRGLWSRKDGDATNNAATEAETPTRQHRPFVWYRDPFRAGTADQMSDVELIRYTFNALEAWARERDLARPDVETPLEFARRLGEEFPALEEEAHNLASYYATAAYAPELLEADCTENMRRLWEVLDEVSGRTLLSR